VVGAAQVTPEQAAAGLPKYLAPLIAVLPPATVALPIVAVIGYAALLYVWFCVALPARRSNARLQSELTGVRNAAQRAKEHIPEIRRGIQALGRSDAHRFLHRGVQWEDSGMNAHADGRPAVAGPFCPIDGAGLMLRSGTRSSDAQPLRELGNDQMVSAIEVVTCPKCQGDFHFGTPMRVREARAEARSVAESERRSDGGGMTAY
jgi:hypothetical protein